MKVLVSGANGFVGHALCGHLDTHQYEVVPAVRRKSGLANEVQSPLILLAFWIAALRSQ